LFTLCVLSRNRRDPARRHAEYAGLVLSAIVLTAGLVVVVARPVTAAQFATLHPLEGTVEVAPGGSVFEGGFDGATLRAEDVVRTGPEGIAEIEYFDGSVTRLNHNTTLTVDRVANIPDAPESKLIETTLQEGRTYHRVQEISDPDSHFEVRALGTVAAAVGTAYVVTQVPEDPLTVWVVPDDRSALGAVDVHTEEGQKLTVREGEGTTVSPTGEASPPFTLTDVHLTDEWVAYNLCQLDEADLEACLQLDEGSIPAPRPQKAPPIESKVLGETVPAPGIIDLAAVFSPAPGTFLIGGTKGQSDATRASFRFGSSDPVRSFECSLDKRSFRPCQSPKRYRGLSDGRHVFLVRAVGLEGDAGPVVRRPWRVDTLAPETVISGPSLSSDGSQALFGFTSSEPRSRFKCRLDGSPFTGCASPTSYAGLGIGTHIFEVRAVDRAGNKDLSPATYSWTVGGALGSSTLASSAAAATVTSPAAAGGSNRAGSPDRGGDAPLIDAIEKVASLAGLMEAAVGSSLTEAVGGFALSSPLEAGG
jgi:hypothetical protein